jgi:tetratricopeptide (TPR) repeat protein
VAAALPDAPAAGRLSAAVAHLHRWRNAGLAGLALITIAALVLVASGRLPWTGADSREVQDLYARAETRLAVGDYEGAQVVYRKLLELQPGDSEAQLGLDRAQRQQVLAQGYAAAEAAIGDENWELAAVELANLLATDPDYADAQAKAEYVALRRRLASLYVEGTRLYDMAQWEEAADQFERIRELDGAYRGEAVSQFLFVCYLNAAEGLVTTPGQTLAAVEHGVELYSHALAIYPHNRVASDAHRLATRYLLALRGLAGRDYDQAEAQLLALVSEDPGFAGGEAARKLYELNFQAGRIAEAAGDLPAALALYRRARSIPGTDTSSAVERERAIAAFTPTPTVTPTRPPSPTLTPQPSALVRDGPVALRGGPGSSYPVSGQVEARVELQITGRDAGSLWYRVVTPVGQTGWLAASQLELRGAVGSVMVVTPQPRPTATGSAARPPTATPAPQLIACVRGDIRDPAGGAPLSGWVVRLTDAGGRSREALSDATGGYRFTGLIPGVYTVAITVQEGWTFVSPAVQVVTVSESLDCTGVDFWLQRADTEHGRPTPAR